MNNSIVNKYLTGLKRGITNDITREMNANKLNSPFKISAEIVDLFPSQHVKELAELAKSLEKSRVSTQEALGIIERRIIGLSSAAKSGKMAVNKKGLSTDVRDKMRNDAYWNFNRSQDDNFIEGVQYMKLGELGHHFDAHGIAKGNVSTQLDLLENILKNGIDKKRPFYTAPLDISNEAKRALGPVLGTGSGTAYKHGSFMLVSAPGKKINNDGVKTVIVNKQFYSGIEQLKQAYPDINFVKMKDTKQYFTNQLKRSNLG